MRAYPGIATRDAIAGFVVGATFTAAAAVFFVQARQYKLQDECSEGETGKLDEEDKRNVDPLPLPSELREEQLSRNTLYFGEVGMESISRCRIAIVGLGGVGSHAAHMLARAGVGYLRLIDFDQVTMSSLNRHAVATLADVGTPKVEAMRKHINRICGAAQCHVDARAFMYTEDDEEDLLGRVASEHDDQGFDFIVDAIDDVTTKVQLLAYCVRTSTRVISCMGAGGKSDVTRIHIGDLSGACHDPLASKIRLFLKRKNVKVDTELINVVYSSEKTVAPLAALSDEQKQASSPGEFGAVDNMRVRVLPVLGTMPAVMGQACAAYALCQIGGKPFSPLSGERMGRNARHRLFQHLKNREKEIRNVVEREAASSSVGVNKVSGEENNDHRGFMVGNQWVGPVQVDCDDVEYLMAEVWRNRCAVTGDRLGVVLELVRWDMRKPSTCNNLVLMSKRAMNAFDRDGKESVTDDAKRRIEKRLAECKLDAMA